MPVFVTGLPVHVLIVHVIVVLLPLSVVGAIVIAFWPAARRRFGWLVVAFAAIATVCVPIATNSGEGLQDRLPPSDLIQRHAELGDQLLWFAIGLTVFSAVLVWIGQREGMAKGLVIGAAVLTIGFAAVSGVQVVRIGDAGARAAWTGVENLPPR